MNTDPQKTANQAVESDRGEFVDLGEVSKDTKGGSGHNVYDGGAGFYF
jgi:hypothetical protein